MVSWRITSPIFLEVGFFPPLVPKKYFFTVPPGGQWKSPLILLKFQKKTYFYWSPSSFFLWLLLLYIQQHAIGSNRINIIWGHYCTPHRNCSRLSGHNLQLLAMWQEIWAYNLWVDPNWCLSLMIFAPVNFCKEHSPEHEVIKNSNRLNSVLTISTSSSRSICHGRRRYIEEEDKG